MESWQIVTVLEKTESVVRTGTPLEVLRAIQVADAALEAYKRECLAAIEHEAASALARPA